MISRRSFHRHALAATGGLLAGAPFALAGEEAKPAPAERTQPPNFFDAHVHLGQPWNERGPLTAEMMLRWMDAHDIEGGFVLPLISPEAWFYPITPHWVLEQTKPYRDRLIPFCTVDPRSVNLGGRKGFLDILKRYQDAGCRGMGEHKWGGAIDDARNIELLGACGEVGLPVLFHLDNIRNTDKPGLPGLEKVLQGIPNVRLIGHAPGFWANISKDASQADMGGYPKGPVVPGGALDRLLGQYGNLYAELSAGSGNNAIARDKAFGREFLLRNKDQILFGSDYLASGQNIPQFDLLASLDLPRAVQEKIYRQNARQLLEPPEKERPAKEPAPPESIKQGSP